MKESLVAMNSVCGVVCAKWALELGYPQWRQNLFLIGGFLFGPLVLLILYVYLIRKAQAEGREGGKWV